MNTMDRQLIANVERLSDHPRTLITAAEVLERLRTGYYSTQYVDKIFQRSPSDPLSWKKYSIGDAYIFGIIHGWLLSKKVAVCTVHVGVKPVADRLMDKNQEALAKSLSKNWGIGDELGAIKNCNPLFRVELQSGNDGADGMFYWDGELEAELFEDIDGTQCAYNVKIPAGKVQIEVGTTSIMKSFMQISRDGGLARWPYDQEDVTLFIPVEPLINSLICNFSAPPMPIK